MNIFSRILRHMRADLYLPMFWIGHLVPKDRRLWVFGSGHGESFSDNSRHFFIYVSSNHRDIRAVWLTRNPTVLQTIRVAGFEAHDADSALGCWLALRAGIAIVSYGYAADLNGYALTRGTRLVQLWHGSPLKKIGAHDKRDDNRPSFRPESERWGLAYRLNLRGRRFFWRLFPRRQIDLLLASSREVSQVLSGALRVPEQRCKVTGYPRNDALFSTPRIPPPPDRRHAVYLPTWRGRQNDQSTFFEFDVRRMDSLLDQHRLVLYFKPHPANSPRPGFSAQIKASRNIRLLESECELHDILGSFDALVTDYSSVYFDYLLLGRPVIFSAWDLDAYSTQDHELYYDYNAVTPGPKVENWDEMVVAIAEELAHPERYAEKRKAIRERFNTYCDSCSSERVFKEVQQLVRTCAPTHSP